MDPVTLIITGLSVARGLAALAVDVAPMVSNIKASIDTLSSGGQISDAQAIELRAKTDELEATWAGLLQGARGEAQGGS